MKNVTSRNPYDAVRSYCHYAILQAAFREVKGKKQSRKGMIDIVEGVFKQQDMQAEPKYQCLFTLTD